MPGPLAPPYALEMTPTISRPRLVDALLAVVLAPLMAWAVMGVSWQETGFARPGTLAVTLAVVASAAVAWRRAAPFASLAVCSAAVVGATLYRYDVTEALPFVVCGLLCSLAYYRDLPVGLAGLAVVLVGFTAVVLSHPPGMDRSNVGWTFGLFGAFWLAGRLIRNHREMLVARAATAEERAVAETGRAALMVSEERLRIARELHDILTHTVSVIAVQATVGEHLAIDDPAAARRSLAVIGESTRGALDELRRLLSVLRDDGDDAQEDLGRAPAHTLADVESLVEGVRAAGVTVRLRTEGDVRSLSPAAEACSFRIVQEALTNVIKHAGEASADIVIAYQPDALELTVTDDGRGSAAAPNRPGHGLPGMRERAALFGGTLVAAPLPAGGFEVRARIPDLTLA